MSAGGGGVSWEGTVESGDAGEGRHSLGLGLFLSMVFMSPRTVYGHGKFQAEMFWAWQIYSAKWQNARQNAFLVSVPDRTFGIRIL
jgi:hypothetical protein